MENETIKITHHHHGETTVRVVRETAKAVLKSGLVRAKVATGLTSQRPKKAVALKSVVARVPAILIAVTQSAYPQTKLLT